ncbi:MAG: YfiR family protein [Opitutaceae bacterium]
MTTPGACRLAIVWMLALPLLGARGEQASEGRTPASADAFPADPRVNLATFTLNLTRFITWPKETFASPEAPFLIGTFPRDSINEYLDRAVRDELVEGHPVRTMRIRSLDDLAKCHLVYLSKNYASRPGVLARVARRPVLAVSDANGFLERGGHVWFEVQAPQIAPHVSLENLRTSGLGGRAQLLRLTAQP